MRFGGPSAAAAGSSAVEEDARNVRRVKCYPQSVLCDALRISLLSRAILGTDNSVPPRISLRLIMAQRLPVASGDPVEVPYDFAAAHGQLRFQLLGSLHARSVNVCKSE